MATQLFIENEKAYIHDLTPEILQDSEVWSDLMDSFESLMSSNVDNPIEQLENIRHMDKVEDAQILINTVRMLGFNINQDLLSMSYDSLTRLVSQLPLYPDNSHSEYFENFVDLLLNAQTTITYLWTTNYTTFSATPGTTLIDGGTWYKTTHVDVTLILREADKVEVGSSSVLARMADVFYEFCPISLVIRSFNILSHNSAQLLYSVEMVPYHQTEILLDS